MSPTHRFLPASALLSAALVWLVSVTLCSTATITAEETGHEVSVSQSEHHHHSSEPAHDHDGQPQNDDCGCTSFKDFTGQTAALAKAPAPAAAVLLYVIPSVDFLYAGLAGMVTPRATGPPGRVAFSDLILLRCRLSHAPPVVV